MTVTSADSSGKHVKKYLRVICKQEGNKASAYIPISIWLSLTGDPDGDALEDGVEAEGDYEQHAVTEGARVAQHGCGRVIRPVCLLRAKNTNKMVTKVTRFCTLTHCKILLVLFFFTLCVGSGLYYILLLKQEQVLSWSNNEFRN